MMTKMPSLADDYVAATRPDPMEQSAEALASDHAARYPGAFSSDEPSPYEKSPLCGSDLEQDMADDPMRLFNGRQPHYPIMHERMEHRVICFLKAQGFSNVEIAEQTGFSAVAVSNIIRQPWAQKRILDIIHDSGQNAVQQLLASEAYESVQRLVIERDNPNARPSERIAAADKLLDRALGKPSQPLDHTIQSKIDDLSDDELERIVQAGRLGGTATSTSQST